MIMSGCIYWNVGAAANISASKNLASHTEEQQELLPYLLPY